MKAFEFIAFDSFGKKQLGTVSAWSALEAKSKIQKGGFYLASIKIKDSSKGSGMPPRTSSGVHREGSQRTTSYNLSCPKFFKWLKGIFLLNQRIEM